MPIPLTCDCGKVHSIDAVPQNVFDARLKEIGAQRDGFKAEALSAQAAKAKLETDAKDWQAAAQELGAMKAKAEEDGALSAAGLRADAAPHHRSYLRSMYEGAPKPADADKPSFAEWLKAQATATEGADPFLVALRAPAAAGAPAPAAPQAPAAPPPRPPVQLPPMPGQQPPAPGGDQKTALLRQIAADAANNKPWEPAKVIEALGALERH